MRLINRGVVVIKPKQPFVDWLRQTEEDFSVPSLEKLRAGECTAVLVPSLFGPNEVMDFLEPLKPTLFEMQLGGWEPDSTRWPAERTSAVFDEWFDLEFHSMVWDAGNAPIITEQTIVTPLDYPPPVNKLLTYGDCRSFSEWPNYVEELGLGPEHIPDLIRMATDKALSGDFSETLAVWAPVHAWRALGQLRAAEAAEPLTQLFHGLDVDDWVLDELPRVYEMIGPPAIPPLARALADDSYEFIGRGLAAESLSRIGMQYPEARDECVAVLTQQLELCEQNPPQLNGFIIGALLDLKAVEALPAIERVFASGRVDERIVNWTDIREELGVTAPKPKARVRRRRRRRR